MQGVGPLRWQQIDGALPRQALWRLVPSRRSVLCKVQAAQDSQPYAIMQLDQRLVEIVVR